ncbi:putative rhamnose biosynthetic enzyme 2 [Escovopsis weberi]|uniref:Putative rhamnose biosynthetic enzyme 2 n=1 Tax=Escovopsis weberi TaxID=150374 RepID=A0A0M9VX90_ESCWE|nr:putative rhamnose biosynthetic enzyme 2 [Escovopsis weberi]
MVIFDDGDVHDRGNVGMPFFLITGSSGHLGSCLYYLLLKNGYRVVRLDIKPAPETVFVGSVRDRDMIDMLFRHFNIKHVVHCAALHERHLETHNEEDFVDTNVEGTAVILDKAREYSGQIESFTLISDVNVLGQALNRSAGSPALWIDEEVAPIPTNKYHRTKLGAEKLCHEFHQKTLIPAFILRAGRFHMDEDHVAEYARLPVPIQDENLKVMELAYCRCDIHDLAYASMQAMRRCRLLKFGLFVISSRPPFDKGDDQSAAGVLNVLAASPGLVLNSSVPGLRDVLNSKRWRHLPSINRVYSPKKAMRKLHWKSQYTFKHAIEKIKNAV